MINVSNCSPPDCVLMKNITVDIVYTYSHRFDLHRPCSIQHETISNAHRGDLLTPRLIELGLLWNKAKRVTTDFNHSKLDKRNHTNH